MLEIETFESDPCRAVYSKHLILDYALNFLRWNISQGVDVVMVAVSKKNWKSVQNYSLKLETLAETWITLCKKVKVAIQVIIKAVLYR